MEIGVSNKTSILESMVNGIPQSTSVADKWQTSRNLPLDIIVVIKDNSSPVMHSLASLPLEPPINDAEDNNADIPHFFKRSGSSSYSDKNLQPPKCSNLATTSMLMLLALFVPLAIYSLVTYTQTASNPGIHFEHIDQI